MPKLLLADDSVTIQRVIELTFAEEDVEVLTAGDGEQAISKIQSDRPDIVLADIGMPKRSGYDVAAFVKGQPEFSHIPVLLLTGAFEPVDETRAQAAGCDGVLVKPFEPQHVIARVRELLQADPARQRRGGSVTRAVADVPRPAERLAPPRAASPGHEIGFPREASGRGPADASLDDYFDRLDAAFANLSSPAAETPVRHPEVMPRGEGPVMEKDLDWFDTPLSSAAADAPSPQPVVEPPPATFATPPSPLEWPLPQAASIERPEAPSEMTAYAQPQPQAAPSPAETSGSAIADAFSALLAAEQGEPGAAPVRLTLNPAPPAVNEQLIDEITRRVVERLAPHVLREVVADVVSDVSERLVRDEIQRIRNQANHDS